MVSLFGRTVFAKEMTSDPSTTLAVSIYPPLCPLCEGRSLSPTSYCTSGYAHADRHRRAPVGVAGRRRRSPRGDQLLRGRGSIDRTARPVASVFRSPKRPKAGSFVQYHSVQRSMDAPPHSNLRMLRCEVICVSITQQLSTAWLLCTLMPLVTYMSSHNIHAASISN